MMISQTTEYALRAVVWLALTPDVQQGTKKISEAIQVPSGYLSKVLQKLTRAGLVTSSPGRAADSALRGIRRTFESSRWSTRWILCRGFNRVRWVWRATVRTCAPCTGNWTTIWRAPRRRSRPRPSQTCSMTGAVRNRSANLETWRDRIKPEYEAEVSAAFRRSVEIRALSGGGREPADQYFLETLIRLHREGEGAPFTGLGDPAAPIVAMADQASPNKTFQNACREVAPGPDRPPPAVFAAYGPAQSARFSLHRPDSAPKRLSGAPCLTSVILTELSPHRPGRRARSRPLKEPAGRCRVRSGLEVHAGRLGDGRQLPPGADGRRRLPQATRRRWSHAWMARARIPSTRG